MTAPQIEFTDPRTTPFVEPRWRGHLPHLYKEGGSYFVTLRLWDAVTPADQRDSTSLLCGAGVPPALPSVLTRGAGVSPALPSVPTCGAGVSPALPSVPTCGVGVSPALPSAGVTPAPQINQRRPKSREEIAAESEPPLRLGSCVLENPDIAALVQKALLHFHTLRYDLHAWCVMPNHVHVAYTARGEHTPADIHHSWKSYTAHKANKILKRSDAFWESEGFDHLIRSVEDLEWFIEYIENNPVAAGLCASPIAWLWTSARPGNWIFPAQEHARS